MEIWRRAHEKVEMPPGIKIISILPSGASAWVHTVRIEGRLPDGTTMLFFMKASILLGAICIFEYC